MIDLSSEAILKSLEARGRGFKDLIDAMEERENWTLDNEASLKRALINWAANVTPQYVINLDEGEHLGVIRLLAFMSSGRSLKLLSELNEVDPGIAAKLLIIANNTLGERNNEDVRPVLILRDRLVTLYQANFLQRIFAPERMEGIRNVVEK